LECGQPKTHQIQSHGGEPRGLSIISTSKKQRKFFGIHHRISARNKREAQDRSKKKQRPVSEDEIVSSAASPKRETARNKEIMPRYFRF